MGARSAGHERAVVRKAPATTSAQSRAEPPRHKPAGDEGEESGEDEAPTGGRTIGSRPRSLPVRRHPEALASRPGLTERDHGGRATPSGTPPSPSGAPLGHRAPVVGRMLPMCPQYTPETRSAKAGGPAPARVAVIAMYPSRGARGCRGALNLDRASGLLDRPGARRPTGPPLAEEVVRGRAGDGSGRPAAVEGRPGRRREIAPFGSAKQRTLPQSTLPVRRRPGRLPGRAGPPSRTWMALPAIATSSTPLPTTRTPAVRLSHSVL